jgi:hypothetical protein
MSPFKRKEATEIVEMMQRDFLSFQKRETTIIGIHISRMISEHLWEMRYALSKRQGARIY